MPKDAHPANGAWLFAVNFFKHPVMLGSMIPSSRQLIEALLDGVDWSQARHVVEFGPGVGTVTRPLLKRLPADAELLALETNGDFVRYLKESIDDPRLTVLERSAADLTQILAELGWDGMDHAVSGIPFSTLPGEVREAILADAKSQLRPGGEFLIFQFADKVRPYLEQTFDHVDARRVLWNVPPAIRYRCSDDAPAATATMDRAAGA